MGVFVGVFWNISEGMFVGVSVGVVVGVSKRGQEHNGQKSSPISIHGLGHLSAMEGQTPSIIFNVHLSVYNILYYILFSIAVTWL